MKQDHSQAQQGMKQDLDGIFGNTGVNCFWVINNAQLISQSMHTLNDTLATRTL